MCLLNVRKLSTFLRSSFSDMLFTCNLKRFAIAFLFSLFSLFSFLYVAVLGPTGKGVLTNLPSFFTQEEYDRDLTYLIGCNIYIYIFFGKTVLKVFPFYVCSTRHSLVSSNQHSQHPKTYKTRPKSQKRFIAG